MRTDPDQQVLVLIKGLIDHALRRRGMTLHHGRIDLVDLAPLALEGVATISGTGEE
jgi:hypothetical protein